MFITPKGSAAPAAAAVTTTKKSPFFAAPSFAAMFIPLALPFKN